MPTSDANVLQALRAAITLEKAKPTPDNDVVKTLRAEILAIKADPAEEADKQKADLATLRIDPATLTQSQLFPVLNSVASYYATLPFDDPDPSVVDQKKIRGKLRGIVDNPAADQIVRDRCEYLLRAVLKDYRNADPVEVKFSAILADLAGGNFDAASLPAILDDVRGLLPLAEQTL